MLRSVILAGVFSSACWLAAAEPQPPEPKPAPDRVQAWQEDLDALAKTLTEKHANAFAKISKPQFDAAIADLRKSIPNLKDAEIGVGMMKLTALLGDGHTMLGPAGSRAQLRSYPLGLIWLKEGLYIAAVPEEQKDLLGLRVVAIGKTPLNDALARVAALRAAENEWALRDKARSWLANGDALAALGLLDDPAKGQYTVMDSNNKRRVVEMTFPAGGAATKFTLPTEKTGADAVPSRRRNRPRYGSEWIESGKALYCWYDQCADLAKQPVSAWCKELLAEIDDKKPEHIVFDLRRNGGGNSALVSPLLLGLKARPDAIRDGKFAVLIGPGTYSSAMMNAGQFRSQVNATLIGLPTGGSPNEYGEVKLLTLPNSKWMLQYSTRYFKNGIDGSSTLLPDIVVVPTAEEFFRGDDPVYQAAIIR